MKIHGAEARRAAIASHIEQARGSQSGEQCAAASWRSLDFDMRLSGQRVRERALKCVESRA